MASATDFAKMVPGFDFLQGLMKNAGAGLPQMSQWIAPTLDPKELDKRIEELRTVQFWLEQNARLLGTTIQALEVQRMTLSTLQTMNLPLADLRESLKVRVPAAAEAGAATAGFPFAAAAAAPEPARASAPAGRARAAGAARAPARKSRPAADAKAPPPAVDPMQWWGALTQQFAELATKAVRDGAADASRQLAGAMVKQSIDTAGQQLRKAATAVATNPVKAAARTAGAMAGAAGSVASAAGAAVAAPRRRRSR